MTHTRRLQILRNLEPGLMQTQLHKLLHIPNGSHYRVNKLCAEAGYNTVNGTGTKYSMISNPKLIKRYGKMQWNKGMGWLQKRHKISRQTLSHIRQQLDFISLFLGRTKLTYAQCKKKMRALQDSRREQSLERQRRRFKDLKVEEYLRWGRLLGIEVEK